MSVTTVKYRLIVFSLLSVFFAQSYLSLSTKSATFDEVQYFGIGKYLLKHHKWDVMGAILHPPLSFYLNDIPLLFAEQPNHVWDYDPGIVRNRDFLGAVDYYRGQALLSDKSNSGDRLLIASRLMTTMLAMLLGWYVYRFSTLLYGENGGIMSVFLFVFNPLMLAFSGLIVPDMPLTAFAFITLYYVWRSITAGTTGSYLLAGLFLGLTLLTKFTALIYVPPIVLFYAIAMYRRKQNITPLVLLFAISILVLLAGYGFNLNPYFDGLMFQLNKNRIGQAAFLMGSYSDHGWWYFYPLAFILKTPIAVLLLVLTALAVMIRKKKYFNFDSIILLSPVIMFMLVFMLSNVAIGVRYLLPVYPLLFVFIGSLWQQQFLKKLYVCILSGWSLVATLYICPDYLAYYNEIVGGPGNGYKYLVDSNLDWGQDLKTLKKYMDLNDIKRISLSYFGADSPSRYGIEYDWLPSHYLYKPEAAAPTSLRQNQLIAVSATNLQGVYLESKDEFQWLSSIKPIAKIGYSIFIYDLSMQR